MTTSTSQACTQRPLDTIRPTIGRPPASPDHFYSAPIRSISRIVPARTHLPKIAAHYFYAHCGPLTNGNEQNYPQSSQLASMLHLKTLLAANSVVRKVLPPVRHAFFEAQIIRWTSSLIISSLLPQSPPRGS